MSTDQIIALQKVQIDKLEARVSDLNNQLEQLKKMIFGRSNERFVPDTVHPDQLNIFGQISTAAPSTATEEISYKRSKAKPHPGRNELPKHLPVTATIIEPENVSEDMIKIGEQITETVEYTPASLTIKRIIRPKYAHPQSDLITIAALPDRSMPKCMAEPSLVAYLIMRKFVEHMPFYRQLAQLKRDYKWILAPSTLCNWFAQVCKLLDLLYAELRKQILQSTYLQADESPISVLDRDKPQSTHQGYQWVYHSPEKRLILFDYRKGRGKAGPKEILQNYKGILQCDGWQVYDKIAQRYMDIILAGCLAHVRRKFYEAIDNDSGRAQHALNIIKQIYLHERIAKEQEDRKAYRDQHMAPLLVALKEWADQQAIQVLPQSPIAKAIGYFIKQYHKLETIFQDGRIELDNNLIENKIRPLALGRKNYLFAGSHQGAQRIAMMYSFFASCKANDVNPYKWLKYTLSNIHKAKISELHKFLPNNLNL